MKRFAARENLLWHALVANRQLMRYASILLLMAAVGAVLSHWEPAEPWSEGSMYCVELTVAAATDLASEAGEPAAVGTCS
jgi:hypothetical protein